MDGALIDGGADLPPVDAPYVGDLRQDLKPNPDLKAATDLQPKPDLKPKPDGGVTTKQVSTLAGMSSATACSTGTSGPAASWKFLYPVDLVAQGDSVYVVDRDCHRILQIYKASTVTVVAGSGVKGFKDGPAAGAQFNGPTGITIDSAGVLYVADRQNHRVRKIVGGMVSTVAGSTAGYVCAIGVIAQFNGPTDVAVDSSGSLYVTDYFNYRVRKVEPGGAVSDLAGTGTYCHPQQDGAALSTACFSWLNSVAVSSTGKVYVTDGGNHAIRRIEQGVVTTVAGSTTGINGHQDGAPLGAFFYTPAGLAVDGTGRLYIGDRNNFRIRTLLSQVSTLAGTGLQGYVNGPALTTARFMRPLGVTVGGAAAQLLYIADAEGKTVRVLDL